MKTQITLKQLKQLEKEQPIVAVSQGFSLLEGTTAQYYHAGVYGWNFDLFVFDGISIIYGYRYSSRFPRLPYKVSRKWDKRAMNASLSEKKELLSQFVEEIKKEYI